MVVAAKQQMDTDIVEIFEPLMTQNPRMARKSRITRSQIEMFRKIYIWMYLFLNKAD